VTLGYLLPVGDTHVRVNPKLSDAPPAHWVDADMSTMVPREH